MYCRRLIQLCSSAKTTAACVAAANPTTVTATVAVTVAATVAAGALESDRAVLVLRPSKLRLAQNLQQLQSHRGLIIKVKILQYSNSDMHCF